MQTKLLLSVRNKIPQLIHNLERELYLAGGACRFADDAEAAPADGVGGQPKVYDVEDVEKFSAKLQNAELPAPTMAEGCVFDDGDIELMESGAAKRVPA